MPASEVADLWSVIGAALDRAKAHAELLSTI
jgi:hypothetical protein